MDLYKKLDEIMIKHMGGRRQVNSFIDDQGNNHYSDCLNEIQDLIKDDYHTLGELYEHRNRLFISLLNEFQNRNHVLEGNEIYAYVWKSKLHSDGTSYPGWFIAGTGVSDGEQISYHLPIDMWDDLVVPEKDKAPKWDGHTSYDVLERLKNF